MTKCMTFELKHDAAFKKDNGKYYNVPSLLKEIHTLIQNGTVNAGLKYDYKPNKSVIYSFSSNADNQLYNSLSVSSVKIVVNEEDLQRYDKYIKFLDRDNSNSNVTVYKKCPELFEVGLVKGYLVNGFSLATYAVEKNTKDLVKVKEEKKKTYHKKDLSKFLIF